VGTGHEHQPLGLLGGHGDRPPQRRLELGLGLGLEAY
jgi:hypothetical protein